MTTEETLKMAIAALKENYKLINGTDTKLGLEGAMDGYYSKCFDVEGINKKTKETIKALEEALKQEQCEPVAWRTFDGEGGYDYRSYEDNETYRDEYITSNGQKYSRWVEPLYTIPPQRKPLTDEQMNALWFDTNKQHGSVIWRFARAIEAAHGIKE